MLKRAIFSLAVGLPSGPTFAATPVLVDAAGTTLGIPLRTLRDAGISQSLIVVKPTGYLVNHLAGTGAISSDIEDVLGNRINGNRAYFESTNCSGQAYLTVGDGQTGAPGGFVIASNTGQWGSDIVYVPKAPAATVRTLRSVYLSASCQTTTVSAATVVPLPNISAVTGVLGPAVPPVHLDVVSDCIFSSGFECTSGAAAVSPVKMLGAK